MTGKQSWSSKNNGIFSVHQERPQIGPVKVSNLWDKFIR